MSNILSTDELTLSDVSGMKWPTFLNNICVLVELSTVWRSTKPGHFLFTKKRQLSSNHSRTTYLLRPATKKCLRQDMSCMTTLWAVQPKVVHSTMGCFTMLAGSCWRTWRGFSVECKTTETIIFSFKPVKQERGKGAYGTGNHSLKTTINVFILICTTRGRAGYKRTATLNDHCSSCVKVADGFGSQLKRLRFAWYLKLKEVADWGTGNRSNRGVPMCRRFGWQKTGDERDDAKLVKNS